MTWKEQRQNHCFTEQRNWLIPLTGIMSWKENLVGVHKYQQKALLASYWVAIQKRKIANSLEARTHPRCPQKTQYPAWCPLPALRSLVSIRNVALNAGTSKPGNFPRSFGGPWKSATEKQTAGVSSDSSKGPPRNPADDTNPEPRKSHYLAGACIVSLELELGLETLLRIFLGDPALGQKSRLVGSFPVHPRARENNDIASSFLWMDWFCWHKNGNRCLNYLLLPMLKWKMRTFDNSGSSRRGLTVSVTKSA